MFSRLLKAMVARQAAARQKEAAAQRVLVALLRQVQAAATLRQLVLVQALAQDLPSLPGRLRAVVRQQVALRLVQLPAPVVAQSPASRRSSSSKTQRGKSTTRRRR